MARFSTGADAIRKAAESTGGSKDFAPQLTWKGGETKYIQFITPLEEIPTVEMYQFMKVGVLDSGDPMYRTFISPRDPALLAGLTEDDPQPRDYLAERGLRPKRRQVALAVELEAETELKNGKRRPSGFSVMQRTLRSDGGEKQVPAVGVIIQSHIFFGWFATFAEDQDIEDHVFKVTRRGNDQNTAYDSTAIWEAIDISGLQSPINFDEYLDELSDEERMRKLVEDKPDDWEFDRFATRGKAKSQPKARYTETVEEEETEKPRSRRVKFAAIKEKEGAKRE